MTALPTLSHLRAYSTDHLINAADHWTTAAGRWDNTYITVDQETRLLDREGASYEADVARIGADRATVQRNANALLKAAGIAREAASSLSRGARDVTHLADEATENGFIVNEDYSVDFPPTRNVAEYKEKAIKSVEYSADLRFRAGKFTEHEYRTATDLIQAVDNHTIPDPPPGPVPPGKQWWYHEGTGWKLDDHLQQCDGMREYSDIAGIIFGTMMPQGFPGSIPGLANAFRSIIDINQCEGP